MTTIDGVWATICQRLTEEMTSLIATAKANMIKDLGEIFKGFVSDFDMMCRIDEKDDPALKQLHSVLGENVKKAEAHLNGPMAAAVEGIESGFR